MIFVTVSGLGFDRLVKKMDEIAPKLKEKVVMQIGKGSFKPKNAEFFRFKTRKEIEPFYARAGVVVCHAGEGCIMDALKNSKPCVVVPRYYKFREHVNDHQLDITKTFEKTGKIIAVFDEKNLLKAIEKARAMKSIAGREKPKIFEAVNDYIKELEAKKRIVQ